MSESICTWPDGQQRRVMVTAMLPNDMAHVIWNERVDSDCKAVTGFDEAVPLAWLKPAGEAA